MIPASRAETRRSISPWATLHQRTSESRIRQAGGKRRGLRPRRKQAWLALLRKSGNILNATSRKRGERHGTAGGQGRGYHRRDKRHRATHRGDFRGRRRQDRRRRTTRAGG